MPDTRHALDEMNQRSREVFRRVVEGYLASGTPVGSKALMQDFSEKVSSATIRNVMQELEVLGLLQSPHVSAGRIPTNFGLRLFVDSLLEVDPVSASDREKLDATRGSNDHDLTGVLDKVGSALSSITQSAALVLTSKHEAPIKHIEFVSIGADRALVVLVFADGNIENRVFTLPLGTPPSALREASNFINGLGAGLTLAALRSKIGTEVAHRRRELDVLARDLIERGLAAWQDEGSKYERLIVRGQANLLDATDSESLERIRELFDDLERQRDIIDFLDLTEAGEGVRVFIGAENRLFSLTGSTLVFSPYMNADRQIIGAVGVIGPTRLNYGRIVPIVDYTAQLVGRLLGERGAD